FPHSGCEHHHFGTFRCRQVRAATTPSGLTGRVQRQPAAGVRKGRGAALSILGASVLALPVPQWVLTPLAAFAGTLIATAIIWLVARTKGTNPEILVLAGIAVLFFFQSLQALVQFMASPEVLQQIVFWLFGSLLRANWTAAQVSGVILLACLPFIARDLWALTTRRLGHPAAKAP
ncbi:MAG: iron chelate uptake ABC transporter family permease subunit, partial [Pararhodobacter sp.]|nr:iron chelate uptake ABC transporter family permease subunit [Pararhodobacter sp.]